MNFLLKRTKGLLMLAFAFIMVTSSLKADVPDAPSFVEIQPAMWQGESGVFLLWKHDGDDDVNFNIYRAEGETQDVAEFSELSEDLYDILRYTDDEDDFFAYVKHGNGNLYSYYITAENDEGESSPSLIKSIKLFSQKTRVVFTTQPPRNQLAELGVEWTYDVDAEALNYDGEIVYTLLTAPDGATIDEATGEISWTPQEGGFFEFGVKAEVDGEEYLFAKQYWNVKVKVCDVPGTLIVDVSSEDDEVLDVVTINIFTKFDDEIIHVRKVRSDNSSPAEIILDKGVYTFEVSAFSTRNNESYISEFWDNAEWIDHADWFDIECDTELFLNVELERDDSKYESIKIVSKPTLSAKSGEEYSYQVEVETDADDDDIIIKLMEGPESASIDENGLLTWTPAEDQNGAYFFGIQAVVDGSYQSDFQQFEVNVIECDVPAVISGNVTDENGNDIKRGTALLFNVDIGKEQNVDEYRYSIVAEIIDGEYKFDNVDKGTYFLYFNGYGDKREGAGYFPEFYNDVQDMEDADTIFVDCADELSFDAELKSLPSMDTFVEITSEPVKIANIDVEYQYQVELETNYDGYIGVNLVQGPKGATIDENGLITWTPSDFGRYKFKVVAGVNNFHYLSDYQEFSVVVSECDELSTISGTIQDENGNPIEYGIVLITDGIMLEDQDDMFVEYIEFENGEYSFTGLDKGTYYIYADGSGVNHDDFESKYYGEWFDNKFNLMEANGIELNCGEELTANFELEEKPQPNFYTVSGTVTDQDTGENLPWINVNFMGTNEKTGARVNLSTWTDEDGEYTVELTDLFTYIASASTLNYKFRGDDFEAEPYWPEFYDNVSDPTEATDLILTDDIEDIDFSLERIPDFDNSLSGSTVGENGEIISPSMIVAFLVDPADDKYDDKLYYSRGIEADDDGGFMLENLIPGDYVLMAYPFNRTYVPGYYKEGEVAVESWENATLVEVTEDGDASGNKIMLKMHKKIAGKGRIRGSVGRQNGKTAKIGDKVAADKALVGAMIFAHDESGSIVKSIETDHNGAFDFGGLKAGTYNIKADKVGYFSMDKTVTIIDEDDVVEANMTLDTRTTSVEDNITEINRTNVYPNPAVESFKIQHNAEKSGMLAIKISDINGNAIYENTANAISGINIYSVNLNSASNGTYFIEITESNGTKTITPVVLTK